MRKTKTKRTIQTPGQSKRRDEEREARVIAVEACLEPGLCLSLSYLRLLTSLSVQSIVHALTKLEERGAVYRLSTGVYQCPSTYRRTGAAAAVSEGLRAI